MKTKLDFVSVIQLEFGFGPNLRNTDLSGRDPESNLKRTPTKGKEFEFMCDV